MRIYAYLRVEPGFKEDLNEYYSFFNKYGYHIQKNRLIWEEVAVDTPIFYRDKIVNLVNYSLEEDNILIIKGLDSLGANFVEISEFINIIESRKIILICLDYSRNEIKGDIKRIFFHFIKMGANFEMNFKRNKKSNLKSDAVKRVGRPEILNNDQKREVVEKFKKGFSVYSLAKEYSVTRTVIQRLLNKETEKFSNFNAK
ncbi:recombinase family protein [Acinetobacter sp. I-MWF]|uniref:recombinase family protein n=1 Tax=Acinetobacter sp. I-MWF TaxID=2940517 RepID=UPI0021C918C0|nr:recombinase family protein [Acinetobacter sp. I-MWF]MCT9979427.1 recombinase family protein [Acinetobacter sp. I-MWF]